MINNIIVHHSASKRDTTSFEQINQYHKQKWNFKSSLGFYAGYHYFIDSNGRVTQARDDNEEGAHCKGYNNNIGICLAGNFNDEKPADEQIFALRDLLRRLTTKHNLTANNIIGHRDVGNTACPGSNIDIDFIRSLVEDNKSKIKEEIIKLLQKVNELLKSI